MKFIFKLLHPLLLKIANSKYYYFLGIDQRHEYVKITPNSLHYKDGKYITALFWEKLPLVSFLEKVGYHLRIGLTTITPNPYNDNSVYCYPGTWAQCQAGTATLTLRGGSGGYITAQFISAGTYSIERYFFTFDTSSIGLGNTIVSASLSATAIAGVTNGTRKVNVYNSSNGDTIGTSDFTKAGSTAWCDTSVVDTSFSNGSTVSWTFNATGISGISLTGKTHFCLREVNKDVANIAPTDNEYVGINNGTSANKPVLTITYNPTPSNAVKSQAVKGWSWPI